jgi:hypothetical protein
MTRAKGGCGKGGRLCSENVRDDADCRDPSVRMSCCLDNPVLAKDKDSFENTLCTPIVGVRPSKLLVAKPLLDR